MGAAKIEGDLNALNGKSVEVTKKSDETKRLGEMLLNSLDDKNTDAKIKSENTKRIAEMLLNSLDDKNTDAKIKSENTKRIAEMLLNSLDDKNAIALDKNENVKDRTDDVLNNLEAKRSFFSDVKLDNTKDVTETLLHLLEEKRDSFDKLTEAKLIEIDTGVSDAKNIVLADIDRIDSSINEILSRSDVSIDKILTKLQNIHDITNAKEIELTNTIDDLQTRLSNSVDNTIAREELKAELATRRIELQLTARIGLAIHRTYSTLTSVLRLFGIQLDPSLQALVSFGFTIFNQTIALANMRATEAAVQGGVNAWANWAAAMTYIQAGLMFANAMKTMYESRQIQNDIKETIAFTTIYANEVNLS